MTELDFGTWVDIDPSVRTSYGTYAARDDVHGPIAPGDVVNVRTPDWLIGGALVMSVDDDFVHLSLAWNTLTSAYKMRWRDG